MENLTEIWNDLESILTETEKEVIKERKSLCCNHINFLLDREEGAICADCGLVLSKFNLIDCEWNNYSNDDGSKQKDMQRGDTWHSDNPYDTGGSIPGAFLKNKFMMRLHYQQTFCHKQKVFWQISTKFENYISSLQLSSPVLETAKKMWHIYMESGKLTRASVRNGIIGSCLYYSCLYNNIPINREELIENIEGNNKGFLKGEKIFCELMSKNPEYSKILTNRQNIKENDSFIKYVGILEVPFNTSNKCNLIYEKLKDELEVVTPKSAIAGILYYVIKHDLKLKYPGKTKICQVINVCIPTINKVITIIETNLHP
tara:strand:- start:695 stop:1642 length:948 start_codon:yes stop_codon:yes gene_type:complete